MILSGGLGEGEWVILIKALCLLPLVYWDATRQRGELTSPVEVSCFTACVRYGAATH